MSLFCFLNIKVIKRWQKKNTFKWNRVLQNIPQPNLNSPVKAAATVRGGEFQAEDWRRASVPSNRTEPNRTETGAQDVRGRFAQTIMKSFEPRRRTQPRARARAPA